MKQVHWKLDETIIQEALLAARKVQEFLWDDYSLLHQPYDPDIWHMVFQKRLNKIGEVQDITGSGKVELRKRLLQQAALSIAAIRVLDSVKDGDTEQLGDHHKRRLPARLSNILMQLCAEVYDKPLSEVPLSDVVKFNVAYMARMKRCGAHSIDTYKTWVLSCGSIPVDDFSFNKLPIVPEQLLTEASEGGIVYGYRFTTQSTWVYTEAAKFELFLTTGRYKRREDTAEDIAIFDKD